MALLLAWFGHLVIPHEWVVPCLLMGNVVHQLANNIQLLLYQVFLFYVYSLGSDWWFFPHKVIIFYFSYCSFYFPQHLIHFDSNSHLMYYLPLFFFLVFNYFCPSILFAQVLLVWLWINMYLCDQKYPFWSSFSISTFRSIVGYIKRFKICVFWVYQGSLLNWSLKHVFWQ